ncbi:MAG: hypothetical protein TECD_00405 [Hyphomicrobiaceae bacterium hypho_1]
MQLLPSCVTGSVISIILVINLTDLIAKASDVYTIKNHTVEAKAQNAVTAKKIAIKQGRITAFHSLLKRIIPVTSYNKMSVFSNIDPIPLTRSIVVQSESSSTTRYIAKLDFSFSQSAVQNELRRTKVPYVDIMAPLTTIVLIYSPPLPNTIKAMSASKGRKLWHETWSVLDLKNSVTPLKLHLASEKIQAKIIKGYRHKEPSLYSLLKKTYKNENVLIAYAKPNLKLKSLIISLFGRDSLGSFYLIRKYKLNQNDFKLTLHSAAVILHGIIEGRWKFTKKATTANKKNIFLDQDIKIWVEFKTLPQWQRLQKMLRELPGMISIKTSGLSTNGANVQLHYSGSVNELQNMLTRHGKSLRFDQNGWILR